MGRTILEERAIRSADKAYPYKSDEKKFKKLGEEVAELGFAMAQNDEAGVKDEIGDCLYVLLHIASQHTKAYSLMELLELSHSKLKERGDRQEQYDVAVKLEAFGEILNLEGIINVRLADGTWFLRVPYQNMDAKHERALWLKSDEAKKLDKDLKRVKITSSEAAFLNGIYSLSFVNKDEYFIYEIVEKED